MKTLVLQLDRTEDAGSIRDKVTWGKASRVLLVWPVNYVLLDRKIDLVTIKMICSSQGSRLGIVCDIPEVVAEAEEIQIPIFDSVNQAMRKSWDRRKSRKTRGAFVNRNTGKPDIEQLRIDKYSTKEPLKINNNIKIIFFVLGLLSVLALLLVLFPSAKVTIFPQGRLAEMQIAFSIREIEGKNSTPGILAAKLKNITIQGGITVPTTGLMKIPDRKASGFVTITNPTSSEVTIPAGSIVQQPQNPPIQFKISREVTIPAKESFARIGIEAVEAGERGNLDSKLITSFDGPLGFQLEVINPEPLTGGEDKSLQAVSKGDIDLANDQLQRILLEQATKEFSKNLEDQEISIPSSIQVVKVVSSSGQPGVGQAGKILKLTQKVEFSILIIDRRELEKQSETILTANQPIKGWSITNENPLNMEILSQVYDKETGSAILRTSVSKRLIPQLNTDSIRSQIAGKNKTSAAEIINSSILTSQPPEFQTYPDWLPFLPLLSPRIQLEVQ
jgi:hypothetical protein